MLGPLLRRGPSHTAQQILSPSAQHIAAIPRARACILARAHPRARTSSRAHPRARASSRARILARAHPCASPHARRHLALTMRRRPAQAAGAHQKALSHFAPPATTHGPPRIHAPTASPRPQQAHAQPSSFDPARPASAGAPLRAPDGEPGRRAHNARETGGGGTDTTEHWRGWGRRRRKGGRRW